MKLTRQQKIVAAVFLLILMSVIIGMLLVSRKDKVKSDKSAIQPTDIIIPTVDSSVLVQLSPEDGGRKVSVSVNNMPKGTETMEYEISYKATNREAPGIFSVYTVEQGKTSWEKTFDVGTCSSGKCIIDRVEGGMKVRLKFTGSYGDRLFENDFPFAQ